MNGPWTEQGDVKVAGGVMHWASVGSGPPLVLMPKLGGWIADWRHVAPALAKSYRVIAIDNPGHGGSAMNGPPPFLVTLPESAAMVLATLDELGVQKFRAIGNSLGGCILAVAAALFPDRFEKLVLLSVALGGVTARDALLKNFQERVGKVFDAEGRPLPRPFEESKKAFGFTDQSVHDEQNASRAKAGVWVAPSERGVGNAGVKNYLPRITAPTLLIYGARGGYKEFEAVGKAGLKSVSSVHIPDAGSFTHQDNPAATADVALKFLA
ncbi:MAG: alpha/beta hydrolase [Rhodospirillaceae bacterium]|nr:alpha/beta hydrolase [Rhodospirillaceae bacterium]